MQPVVILASRAPMAYALINELVEAFAVKRIIFERSTWRKSLRLMRRRRRRLGTGRVLAQCLFMGWDRIAIRPASRHAIDALLKEKDTRPPDKRVPTVDVADINGPEVLDSIGGIKPSCGVVLGTSLLGAAVMESAPVWLNLHCGITPRYRGVHGAFWAVYEGRPELAGVTVHTIDRGLDTGAIVSQESIDLGPADTYRTLVVKQYLKGASLMREAVARALEGTLSPYRRSDLESKLWTSPTLSEYRAFCRRLQQMEEPSTCAGSAVS
jgi:hypothetical protein